MTEQQKSTCAAFEFLKRHPANDAQKQAFLTIAEGVVLDFGRIADALDVIAGNLKGDVSDFGRMEDVLRALKEEGK